MSSLDQRPDDAIWQTITVDVALPIPDVPTAGATHLYVTALIDTHPVGSIVVPTPFDPCPGSYLADVLGRRFGRAVFDTRLRVNWEDALDATPGAVSDATVLVCTADRPTELQRCLASLRSVIESRNAVVVVDNSQRSSSATERVVEAAGAAYVREPLPGLDRARNRGLAEVATEIVLFTDDDVEIASGWSQALAACFTDPLVMAAAGLVLPAELRTRAQRLAEKVAGHGRGARRRIADGSYLSSSTAGSMGAGSSMAFRTAFLRSIGGFPEELDAGMPTRSGGDHYALYRVLRAGYRISYEPSAIAYHWHRASTAEIHAAVQGYGTGMASFVLHAAGRDRDRSAITEAVPVLVRYLAQKTGRSLRGGQRETIAFALDEVRGVFGGFAGYKKARRSVNRRPDVSVSIAPRPAPWLDRLRGTPVVTGRSSVPSVSIVIPTRGRRDKLLRLLHVLDEQEFAVDQLEVVVCVDGDIDGTAAGIRSIELDRVPRLVELNPASRSRDEGSGAGVARNRGAAEARNEVLLFLDDDVLPFRTTTALAHAVVHAESTAPCAVVGALAVDSRDGASYFEQRIRNWWVDQNARLESSGLLAFSDVCSGNLSLPRKLFEKVGGFTDLRRHEDWELGWRLGRIGSSIRWSSQGAVMQDADVRVGNALEDRWREGCGDATIASRYPNAFHRLRLAGWLDWSPGLRRWARSFFNRPTSRRRLRAEEAALVEFERAGRKRDYSALLDRLSSLSYWRGVADTMETERRWLDLVGTAVHAVTEPGPPIDLEHPHSLAELAAGHFSDVEIVFRGVTLGRAPLRWGGAPFLPQPFIWRVLDHFGTQAVTVAGAGSVGWYEGVEDFEPRIDRADR